MAWRSHGHPRGEDPCMEPAPEQRKRGRRDSGQGWRRQEQLGLLGAGRRPREGQGDTTMETCMSRSGLERDCGHSTPSCWALEVTRRSPGTGPGAQRGEALVTDSSLNGGFPWNSTMLHIRRISCVNPNCNFHKVTMKTVDTWLRYKNESLGAWTISKCEKRNR